MTQDAHIQERVDELVNKAKIALDAIRALSVTNIADPLTDAAALTQAVETIILDAPQLRNNPYGCGEITTRIDKRSTCVAVNAYNGNILSEATRLESIGFTQFVG
ncbi:MAG: hypothetical protein KKD28_14250 [Chloroflexi bacterium]|nr:hypothetical protein [Chloroflexota bacterium]